MDFDYIVLNYYSETDRIYYKDHIIRKYQESNGFSVEEFIQRCLDVIEDRRNNYSNSLFKDFNPTESELKTNNPEIYSRGTLDESQIPIKYNDLEIMKKQILKAKEELFLFNEEQDAPSGFTKEKLKVNLSVPELALLFKMINELKPSIFNTKSNTELYRLISANFSTKKSSKEKGISTSSLKNKFDSPDSNAIDFWEKHLRTMLSEIKKTKNKISK